MKFVKPIQKRRLIQILCIGLLAIGLVWFVAYHAYLYQNGYRFTKESFCKRDAAKLSELAFDRDGNEIDVDLTFRRIVASTKALPLDYLMDTDWPQDYNLIYEAMDENTGELVYRYVSFGRKLGQLQYLSYANFDYTLFTDVLRQQKVYCMTVDNSLSETSSEYSTKTFTLVFAFDRDDVASVSVQIEGKTITADVNGKDAVVMKHTLNGTPKQRDEFFNIMPDSFTGSAYNATGEVVAELVEMEGDTTYTVMYWRDLQ